MMSRTLGIADLGERIDPVTLFSAVELDDQLLYQSLFADGYAVDADTGKTFIDTLYQHVVSRAFHVTERNVGLGFFADGIVLENQPVVPDPSADKTEIFHKALRKPILGAAKCLLLFRFLHTALRIPPYIGNEDLVKAVQDDGGKSGIQELYCCVDIFCSRAFDIGERALP